MNTKVTILSLGGGIQSTALALLLDEGRLDGYRKPDCAIFADTQAEPEWVYQTVGALRERVSYPVVTATAGSLAQDTWAIILGKEPESGRKAGGYIDIPAFGGETGGLVKRQCTSNYKIRVIKRKIRELYGWPIQVIQYLGISADEAVRMRSSAEKYIRLEYPLAMSRLSRHDCQEYLRAEAPDIPVGRSACYFCPFHSMPEWDALSKQAPELYEDACRMDVALANAPRGPFSLVKGGLGLREKLAEWQAQKELQGALDFGPPKADECAGVCFV